jgi:hypothetical protein
MASSIGYGGAIRVSLKTMTVLLGTQGCSARRCMGRIRA